MTGFDFPQSPMAGDVFAPPGGPVWRWNGYGWEQQSPGGPVGEAPLDGRIYGRQDADWTEIGTITPQSFGAIADWNGTTGTDNTLAMQAFIDNCEVTGMLGFIPAGQYRITGTLYAGRTSSLRITGICKTQSAVLEQASTLVFDVTDNTHGLIVGATAAARRDGVEIDGLMIHRNTQEPKAGTGVGVTYRGIVQGTFRNVTVRNFATGGYVTENGGVTSGCTFDTVRYEGAMKIGCLIDAAIECDFRHGKMGAATGADACLKIQNTAGGFNPNGNYFRGITLIADDFAPNGATYNLHDTSTGIFNVFTECAFENGNTNNVRAIGGSAVLVTNLTIDNCWFNSSGAGAIYAEDCHITVTGSRVHSPSATDPAITVKGVAASFNNTVGFIQGNLISFSGVAGVVIDKWNGLIVSGNMFHDPTILLPSVIIQNTAQYNTITGNRFRSGHVTGVVENSGGGTNIVANNIQYLKPSVEYGSRNLGGPQQTVGGGVPILQVLGTDGNSPSILQAAYRANAGAPQLRSYKSRGTTVGARGAVIVNDELYHHYIFADDGTADVQAGEMILIVDAVSAGVVSSQWRWNTRNAAGTNGTRLVISGEGNVGINEQIPDYKLDVNGTFGFTPGASVTPVDNGDVVFQLTSNTQLTIKAKGSDAVIRTANITLA